MKRQFKKLLNSFRNLAQTIRQLGNAQLSLVERPKADPNVIKLPPAKRPKNLQIKFLSFQTDITIQSSRRDWKLVNLPKEVVVELFGRIITVPLAHAPIEFARKAASEPKRIIITVFGRQYIPPFKPQTAFNLSLVIIGLIGSLYFGVLANEPAAIAPPSDSSAPIPAQVLQQQSAGMSRSAPTLLSIKSINVKTSLIKLGQNKDGSLEVPKSYDVAGWYQYAPTPGQIGPAIIVGHVDSYKGAAVFYRLKELKRGAIISIKRADGKTVKFKVDTVKQFSQSDFPTQKVYGNLNYPGLRLITCGGQFNQKTLQYSQNTVVYASIVS